MKLKNGVFCLVCAMIISISVPEAFALAAEARADTDPVSPALYILAEESHMAMSGLRGGAISFERDDFGRAVNLSEITEITVTQIPPITDGELRLGNNVITSGQTISGAGISNLTYRASEAGIDTSEFKFRVNGSPVDITCKLYFLDEINGCPTLNTASKNYQDVSTHRNVTLYGSLPCYDPEGDETVIEIVSYPETGILTLTDKYRGEYTFTPTAGYSGKDEFTYVARDKYGNYSASATVSLTVNKPRTSVTYADMKNSEGYNAALTMTEEGIMSGSQVGLDTYFYPELTVSREQFVVMAMNSLGIRDVAEVEKTVFSDDGDISEDMRSYIGVAYELGYVKGEHDANGRLCFHPKRAVTRAEAACILANMINAATPTVTPTFSDSDDIPTWAAPSIYSLNYMGILNADGGNIAPMEPMTRVDTAQVLTAVMNSLRD